MHGGFRRGAGRKKGFAAKDAEEARKYLSKRVAEEIGSLADTLIDKAKDGDVRAVQVLFDRAWGRPRQEIQIIEPKSEGVVNPRIRELADSLNELQQISLHNGERMRDVAKRFTEWHRANALPIISL